MRRPAVAAACAPGVAATAPVPDAGGDAPANSTAGLVAQVWMTNWPVAVVPPVPETPPADPPTGFEEVSPNPCPATSTLLVKRKPVGVTLFTAQVLDARLTHDSESMRHG